MHFLPIMRLRHLGAHGDHQAPSVPQNLAGNVISKSRIDLTWDASTDNVGVDHYIVYQGGVDIAHPTSNSYSVTGLSEYTEYEFTIAAVDAADNHSFLSSAITKRTLDQTAPSQVTDLTATVASISQINLAWTTATDAHSGIDHYVVYRDNVDIAHPATNSYQDTGRSADTQYAYKVEAVDVAGNTGTVSSTVNQTINPLNYFGSSAVVFGLDADHVTTGTGGITQFNDIGANGYNPVQATSGRRPDLVSNGGGNVAQFINANTDQVNFTGFGTAMGSAITNKFGFMYWLKQSGTTPAYAAVLDQHASSGQLKLAVLTRANATNNFAVFLSANGTATNESRFPHSDWTNWHHVAVSYDGTQTGNASRLQLFVDGTSQTLTQSSGSVPSSTFASTDDFRIGGEAAGGGGINYNGFLDTLWLINRPLVQADVDFMKAYRVRT